MDNKTELEKVKAEIESKQEEKEKYEKKLVQLKNQEKKLKRMASIAEMRKVYELENKIKELEDKQINLNKEINKILDKYL